MEIGEGALGECGRGGEELAEEAHGCGEMGREVDGWI